MKTPEQIQQEIDKHVEAIRKISEEIEPSIKTGDKKFVGLLILLYPEDHDKTHELVSTVLGKICFSHTLEFLAELKAEQLTQVLKDAS